MDPGYQNTVSKKAEYKISISGVGGNIKQTKQKYKKLQILHGNNKDLSDGN